MHLNFLAASADFLSTWWGMLLFILLDIAVLVLIIALNYKWLFKRTLDILFSAVFLIVFFPFFLIFLIIDAIYNKTSNAYASLFVTEYYCGKKQKIIKVTTFATERILHDEAGNLLPEEERATPMGRVLKGCGMKYYPALAAVFAGKMSFVGPRPMSVIDASALNENGAERFAVRPGLVSSLELYGGESLTYPDMFDADIEYIARINFFRDIAFFVAKIAHRLRGESGQFGECAESGYIEWLRRSDEITEEEAQEFIREGKEKLNQLQKAEKERKDFERRNFSRYR